MMDNLCLGDQDITVASRVILFTDVHNYSMACPASAADAFAFLQEMCETLGDILVAYQGEIIKYMGDAMLCLFPAHAENEAVECAVELRRAFAGLVSQRGLPPDTELEIGIASGEVAVGVLGHRSLRQKDVLGEVVNQTAAIGHHRGIAVTEPVYSRIKATHETRRLPDLSVKWQNGPLKVWEVLE
ncbi:MAG: adenylate/guanylate cyclase domain-containing protein [Chloroflexi bacterium]|nr:adenylate/guanylate cyclase domain-containing protein [Chloroflexota bacterium]MBU1750536.1 adenylate/guanylate cyclase domain-containing protein [Chloroflexota bacterium]